MSHDELDAVLREESELDAELLEESELEGILFDTSELKGVLQELSELEGVLRQVSELKGVVGDQYVGIDAVLLLASLEASTDLSVSEIIEHVIGPDLDAATRITAELILDNPFAADLAVSTDLSASIDIGEVFGADLTAASDLSSPLNTEPSVATDLTGTTSASAAMRLEWILAATLSSDTAASASVILEQMLSASLAATTGISSPLNLEFDRSADLTAATDLSASMLTEAANEVTMVATLPGSTALSASMVLDMALAATLTGGTDLSASVVIDAAASAALTATTNLTGTMQVEPSLSASLTGDTDLAGSMVLDQALSASLAAASNLTAVMELLVEMTSTLTATTTLTATLDVLAGSHTWTFDSDEENLILDVTVLDQSGSSASTSDFDGSVGDPVGSLRAQAEADGGSLVQGDVTSIHSFIAGSALANAFNLVAGQTVSEASINLNRRIAHTGTGTMEARGYDAWLRVDNTWHHLLEVGNNFIEEGWGAMFDSEKLVTDDLVALYDARTLFDDADSILETWRDVWNDNDATAPGGAPIFRRTGGGSGGSSPYVEFNDSEMDTGLTVTGEGFNSASTFVILVMSDGTGDSVHSFLEVLDRSDTHDLSWYIRARFTSFGNLLDWRWGEDSFTGGSTVRGEWFVITGLYENGPSNGDATGFVDGVQEVSGTATFNGLSSEDNIFIGGPDLGSLEGGLVAVALYDRRLTDAEHMDMIDWVNSIQEPLGTVTVGDEVQQYGVLEDVTGNGRNFEVQAGSPSTIETGPLIKYRRGVDFGIGEWALIPETVLGDDFFLIDGYSVVCVFTMGAAENGENGNIWDISDDSGNRKEFGELRVIGGSEDLIVDHGGVGAGDLDPGENVLLTADDYDVGDTIITYVEMTDNGDGTWTTDGTAWDDEGTEIGTVNYTVSEPTPGGTLSRMSVNASVIGDFNDRDHDLHYLTLWDGQNKPTQAQIDGLTDPLALGPDNHEATLENLPTALGAWFFPPSEELVIRANLFAQQSSITTTQANSVNVHTDNVELTVERTT